MSQDNQKKRNLLHTIFLSPAEARLRAGWRLTLHTILFLLFTTVMGIILFIPVGLLHIGFDSPVATGLNEFSLLLGVGLATLIARRFLDKRSFASLGFVLSSQAGKDLLVGFALSVFPMGLIFAIELSLGWTKFDGFAWQIMPVPDVLGGLAIWLVIFIAGGWAEELLSRGYHLQTLESGLNMTWAVVISSSVFGALHISNPGASWISTLGIVLAGFYLALPYLLTRQLWLSIGVHIGWNFFEGVVFGFPVSGLNTFNLLRHTVSGPELWTGGIFGPEAGLLVLPALVAGSLLIFLYTRSGLRDSHSG